MDEKNAGAHLCSFGSFNIIAMSSAPEKLDDSPLPLFPRRLQLGLDQALFVPRILTWIPSISAGVSASGLRPIAMEATSELRPQVPNCK